MGWWLPVLILCFVFVVVDLLFVTVSEEFENLCSISRNFFHCSVVSSGASNLWNLNSVVLDAMAAWISSMTDNPVLFAQLFSMYEYVHFGRNRGSFWPFATHNSQVPFLNQMFDTGITPGNNFLLVSMVRLVWWCNLEHGTGILAALNAAMVTSMSTNICHSSSSFLPWHLVFHQARVQNIHSLLLL